MYWGLLLTVGLIAYGFLQDRSASKAARTRMLEGKPTPARRSGRWTGQY